MKNMDLLFTKEEMEIVKSYKSEIASLKQRLLRKHRDYIEKNENVIEDFFEHPRVVQIETIASCNAKCIM